MTDNPKRIMALALAETICPGCACAECAASLHDDRVPCPFFHPDNFYYDRERHRFLCCNWIDEFGNTEPPVRQMD